MESSEARRSQNRILALQRRCDRAEIGSDSILRDRAIELGADIRFGVELVSFVQDANGVTARLREQGGHEYALRAAYLIAADGHRSPIREALRSVGPGAATMRTVRSVLFRAPLEEYLERASCNSRSTSRT